MVRVVSGWPSIRPPWCQEAPVSRTAVRLSAVVFGAMFQKLNHFIYICLRIMCIWIYNSYACVYIYRNICIRILCTRSSAYLGRVLLCISPTNLYYSTFHLFCFYGLDISIYTYIYFMRSMNVSHESYFNHIYMDTYNVYMTYWWMDIYIHISCDPWTYHESYIHECI